MQKAINSKLKNKLAEELGKNGLNNDNMVDQKEWKFFLVNVALMIMIKFLYRSYIIFIKKD